MGRRCDSASNKQDEDATQEHSQIFSDQETMSRTRCRSSACFAGAISAFVPRSGANIDGKRLSSGSVTDLLPVHPGATLLECLGRAIAAPALDTCAWGYRTVGV